MDKIALIDIVENSSLTEIAVFTSGRFLNDQATKVTEMTHNHLGRAPGAIFDFFLDLPLATIVLFVELKFIVKTAKHIPSLWPDGLYIGGFFLNFKWPMKSAFSMEKDL